MNDLFNWTPPEKPGVPAWPPAAPARPPAQLEPMTCVCGKAEMDGVRCRFGASHKGKERP